MIELWSKCGSMKTPCHIVGCLEFSGNNWVQKIYLVSSDWHKSIMNYFLLIFLRKFFHFFRFNNIFFICIFIVLLRFFEILDLKTILAINRILFISKFKGLLFIKDIKMFASKFFCLGIKEL